MSERPLCHCHGKPLTRQRNADGSYRWRCMVEFVKRRNARRAAGELPDPEQRKRERRASDNERMALDALHYQNPSMSRDELLAELQRQRQLARSGALAP